MNNDDLPSFAARARESIGVAASAMRFDETRSSRVMRRISIRECCEMIGCDRSVLMNCLEHPDAPHGLHIGRERTVAMDEVLKLRAISYARRTQRRLKTMFWRRPGDPLPVITVASQKGGTGKTLTAAHVAQMANLYWGLRVGVVDADPQSSVSLYFANDEIEIADAEAMCFTRFMGVNDPREEPSEHDGPTLDAFWRRTPWPGIRLMPGGAPIQDADISMHFLARHEDKRWRHVWRLMRTAIERWSQAHPPKTDPTTLIDERNRFDRERYEEALTETLDLIVIDTAPSLTLAQLNAVLACDSLIIPQTMRGFDLSTLRVYLSSLAEYLDYVDYEDPIRFARRPSYILPSMVSPGSDTDLRQVAELYGHDNSIIMPVFLGRSEAVANSARVYQSIYEYVPSRERRRSALNFMANVNAVGDAILSRAVPGLPSRGFANRFIKENLPMLPAWTEEAA